jgi:polysaccharide pyruvyl transferase WcaK-like protein
MNNKSNIGIFGHYGNQNLGDEAIIESMIKNLYRISPDLNISCLSINPFDSAERYKVKSFPIRYREDFFNKNIIYTKSITKNTNQKNSNSEVGANNSNKISYRQVLKSIPVIGFLLKSLVNSVSLLKTIKNEIFFLSKARAFLSSIDLLVITGSNQLLDNFGGPWGFPYTLLKWTMLGKISNTKIAYVSVGAGPLTQKLSYKMLNIALKNADYISYRDKWSKQLIESRIKNINGKIYPDIAHSLSTSLLTRAENKTDKMVIGLNPMPVYDKRYWADPDDEKYEVYINKIALTCVEILKHGHLLKLFSTQTRDGDVITDVINILLKNDQYSTWKDNINVVVDNTIDDLMKTIGCCNIIIATRFHATILPLQLNIPVLGICYYRKSSELLDDVGLENYHVDIDDFTADDLIKKLFELIKNHDVLSRNISLSYDKYKKDLAQQYGLLINMI